MSLLPTPPTTMTETDFTRRFMPFHRRLYATAMSIVGNSDEAVDIVQEVFVRLWQKRADLADLENPEAYCVTVAKRLSIDRLRRNAFLADSPPDENRFAGAPEIDQIEARDQLRVVDSLMARLPANQQKVVRLSSVNGLDNRTISEVTGLSETNVRALLSRGRRRLRELFEKF